MKHIQLTKGKTATVDDEDYRHLSQYKWHSHSCGYAATKIGGELRLMHRMLLETPAGMDTDHINRDRLDNRRSNLRVCTRKENNMNKGAYKARTAPPKASGGVFWHKQAKKWHVYIQLYKKRTSFGLYDSYNHALRIEKLVRSGI